MISCSAPWVLKHAPFGLEPSTLSTPNPCFAKGPSSSADQAAGRQPGPKLAVVVQGVCLAMGSMFNFVLPYAQGFLLFWG